MFGMGLGIVVETAVAILLAVTIGYCVVLNSRLKRLRQDRESLGKIIGDLVHATGLANGAVAELKAAALEAESKLTSRLGEAEEVSLVIANQVAAAASVIDKIARITNAAKAQPAKVIVPEPAARELARTNYHPPTEPVRLAEVPNRLQSALQMLEGRPNFGGKAA